MYDPKEINEYCDRRSALVARIRDLQRQLDAEIQHVLTTGATNPDPLNDDSFPADYLAGLLAQSLSNLTSLEQSMFDSGNLTFAQWGYKEHGPGTHHTVDEFLPVINQTY